MRDASYKARSSGASRYEAQDVSEHGEDEWASLCNVGDLDHCISEDEFAIRTRRIHSNECLNGIIRGDQENMDDDMEIDIDALLSESIPDQDPAYNLDIASILDRQIAREVAMTTRVTTLIIMGNLQEPRCLPAHCQGMGASFKLISMRKIGRSQIAMFSVPVEGEMAELFEEIDGLQGLHAVAFDSQGRTKEAYVL